MLASIRPQRPEDRAAVHALNLAAFDTAVEAALVEQLQQCASPLVALVADLHGSVVGHILFSPVTLPGRPDLRLMGLAPMAVAPLQQRTGIGSALVRAGLRECQRLAIDAVVVLGHPDYYPRFGFVPSARFGLRPVHDVPEEVFMVLELYPGALRDARGVVHYHATFEGLE